MAKSRPVSKVLIVGAEVSPYASVGGQARVLAYLSKALRELGVDARVFMPKFGFIDEKEYKMEMVFKGLAVPTGHVKKGPKELICNVKLHNLRGGVPTYFLENMEYYEKRANVYGYSDDPIRWALLSRGVLEFLRKSEWVPDVIHSNDWHTGLIPNFLKTVFEDDKKLLNIASIFTIHNLSFQGNFDPKNVSEMDFDDGRSVISAFFNKRLKMQNFMRRGIIYADAVNTVSETYSREILTPECGEGLDNLLLELRSKLFGIVNGINYSEFNPQTDKFLHKNYNTSSLRNRVQNKLALQKEFGLEENADIPVLAYEGRLDSQKGLDLIFAVLWPLLRDFGVQFVQVGGGSGHYVDILKKLKAKFPEKVGIHPLPNFTLPRLIFSGADIMLMPSKFEPCGIVQLEAMRYGCIPIVRATGGLGDTVKDFNPDTKEGNGFVFKKYDKWQFFAQVIRALETYRHKDIWKKLQINAMKSDFSWENSAVKYLKLYEKGIYFHNRSAVSED
ncbi:MAG: glycogen/starch synthase [bacterium]